MHGQQNIKKTNMFYADAAEMSDEKDLKF